LVKVGIVIFVCVNDDAMLVTKLFPQFPVNSVGEIG
jgi:hypothetical protein